MLVWVVLASAIFSEKLYNITVLRDSFLSMYRSCGREGSTLSLEWQFHTCTEHTLVIFSSLPSCSLSFPSIIHFIFSSRSPVYFNVVFIFLWFHLWEKAHNACLSDPDLFCLTLISLVLFVFLWMTALLSIVLWGWIILQWPHIPYFLYFLIQEEHLGWSHSLSVVTSAVINTVWGISTACFHFFSQNLKLELP